jgi:DNA-binding winged helix-turn-helix (wHTH) protein/Tol biopolymer transport system component
MVDHDANSSNIIRFGLYEVDLAARELRRSGLVIKLQDRPFEVLIILLERHGEVVSREEFRQRLWTADTFVNFDTSLNTSINKLRQALSDNAENPRFIATAGRRGYRFIAPASVARGSEPAFGRQHSGNAAGPAAGQDTSAAASPAAAIPAAPGHTFDMPVSSPPRRAIRRYAIPGVALVALATFAVLIARVFRTDATPKITNIAEISQEGLLDPWGRLTTDGARLFFLDRVGGHWTLMQVPASGGEAQPFPEPSQNLRVVDVSPDRSQLVSFAFSGRSFDLPLSLTPVVGGSSRRVGNIFADDAVFTPDGKRLVFDRPDGIYACDRDGSHVKKLVSLPGRSENPQWSKDGRRLRFTLSDGSRNGSSIWEAAADGSNPHAVELNLPLAGATCCGRWSVDGRYFFFTLTRDGIQSIWAARESAGSWFSMPGKPVQLTFGPNNYGGLITDAAPNRVYVWSGKEKLEVDRYDPVSGRVQPLVPGVSSHSADLSPNGEWANFTIGGELWRCRADGSQRQSLFSGSSQIEQISWSPDSKKILFQTAESATSGKIFLISSEGGPATELSVGRGHLESAWFPDGSKILVTRWVTEGGVSKADSGIFIFDLQTNKMTKVPGSEGLDHPIVSPDQRRIAAITNFELEPNRPTRLMLFDAASQSWNEVGHGTLVNPVAWSADSRLLYYQDILSEGEQSFRYSTAAQTTEPFVNFTSLLHAGYVRCSLLRPAPDGTLIVSLRRNEVNLYRLDLDLP